MIQYLHMNMNVWIQSFDYSSTTHEDIDRSAALNLFKDYDWDTELIKQRKLIESDADNCPPGIGFMHPTGHVLHICPTGNGKNIILSPLGTKVGFGPSIKNPLEIALEISRHFQRTTSNHQSDI